MKAMLSNGILCFWCPGCDGMMQVNHVRWHWNGDAGKPTLSPSILQTCGPFPDGHTEVCHCFVKDGNIEFCTDCTHSKRGEMPLPDLDDVINLSIHPEGNLTWSRKYNQLGVSP